MYRGNLNDLLAFLAVARERSFTKAAAFLSRQASRGMVLEPTLARKPPNNRTLTDSRFPPVGVSGLLTRLELEGPILYLPRL